MYGLIGKMSAKPGQRDALAVILLEGTGTMPGCKSYVIATDPADPDALWISEVWENKSDHEGSLALPAVQAAISRARPLIAGFSNRVETVPIGGFGLIRHDAMPLGAMPLAWAPAGRKQVLALWMVLVAALTIIALVFTTIYWVGDAPLIRNEPLSMIAIALAGVSVIICFLGWRLFLPTLPRPQDGASAELFWREQGATKKALRVWVLWVGGTMISLVGTLLTASPLTIGTALLGFALLLNYNPLRLERA